MDQNLKVFSEPASANAGRVPSRRLGKESRRTAGWREEIDLPARKRKANRREAVTPGENGTEREVAGWKVEVTLCENGNGTMMAGVVRIRMDGVVKLRGGDEGQKQQVQHNKDQGEPGRELMLKMHCFQCWHRCLHFVIVSL